MTTDAGSGSRPQVISASDDRDNHNVPETLELDDSVTQDNDSGAKPGRTLPPGNTLCPQSGRQRKPPDRLGY